MTYTITTEKCITCDNCLPNCPTNAITKNNDGKFSIDSNLCNDCEGFYGVAQCMASCPTFDGCTATISSLMKSVQNTTNNDWDNWFATYESLIIRLKAKKETTYWQNWFEVYSQKLDRLIHT